MITLDRKLAQEIVTRTMKIIPFNVNVMDARGIIIGSGEPTRLGEQHAGAQLAIAQGRTVEVDDESARYLTGARPGVNLLLTVRGQICGVVGLTGEPAAVRQFGELVRMTAEMILEQDQLNRDLQRDARYREEFVLQLINGDSVNGDLERWATRLGIDLAIPRAAIVLSIDAKIDPDAALNSLQQGQRQLAHTHPEYLSAARSSHELVILAPIAEAAPSAATRTLEMLCTWFKQDNRPPFRIAMGAVFGGSDGAAQSWQSAHATLQIAQSRKLPQRQLSYYELRLPVLLSTLSAGWQAEQLRAPLAKLDAADRRHGVLRNTLKAWFAANGHLSVTAKALYVHRNTLDYRLRQISEITGLDLDNTDDRFLLYVALQLE